MTPILALAVLLSALQLFDGWTTYHVIKLGGRELNPAVRWLMDRIGAYRALVVAKVGAAALAWLLALMPIANLELGHPHSPLGYLFVSGEDIRLGLLGALAVLYVVIAINNWRALERLRA